MHIVREILTNNIINIITNNNINIKINNIDYRNSINNIK